MFRLYLWEQKMVVFHKAMDDVHQNLLEAEREKGCWVSVQDTVVEALPDEITQTKVFVYIHTFC